MREDEMARLAGVIQRLFDEEFARCGGAPEAGSALDQAGLRDGEDIVLDYLGLTWL